MNSSLPGSSSTDPYQFLNNFNVSNCVTVNINVKNYLFWETQIWNLVESQGIMGFLDGTIVSPPETI